MIHASILPFPPADALGGMKAGELVLALHAFTDVVGLEGARTLEELRDSLRATPEAREAGSDRWMDAFIQAWEAAR